MELQTNLQPEKKMAEDCSSEINIKQEIHIETNEVKTELEYNEHGTIENPFENIQLQVKQEYSQYPNSEKSNEDYKIEHEKRVGEIMEVTFATGMEKPNCKMQEETITNMYDDNIEIKQEDDLDDNSCDYSNFEDSQSMDSDEAKALHNVEACLQDDVKIKSEGDLYEEHQHDDMDKVTIKDEIELTVTETHLISNKLINTTSTVTNPQHGLIESQTTKTLVMEILPMTHTGGISLSKIGNPEEILPTSYTNNDCDAMDFDDTFQLNSITGNVMTLEQEAYGLLEAKSKIDKEHRPYVCTKCPKAYKTASCLRKHKNVHESIEKRAMGIIKGQKTRMANMKKKMKQENKKFSPKVKKEVKKEIKIENVTPIQDNVKKEGYECTCGKVFRRRSRMETCLRSHNMCSDLSSYFPCVTCTKQFKDKEELALHRKRLHRKRFPCKFCPTDYNTRKELFKHLQIHQKVQVMEYKVLSEVVKGKQKLKCFMCAKTCTELSELKSHVMDDHKEPYICPHCHRTFSKIIDFGNHTKTDHPEVEGQSVLDVLEAFSKLVKAWKCEECEVQFHEADKLAMHQIEKHSPDLKIEPQFRCVDCRRVFISQKGLTSHRRVHHSTDSLEDSETVEKGVMCIECRKICKDLNALTSHMRLHSMERKYPCKFCDFRFATPEKRKAHAELHTGDMKFVCFICEYQCSSENRLKQHKASAKHLSMKEFLATGKALVKDEQSTSKKVKSESSGGKEEWVVVKEKKKEVDSDGEVSSNAEGSTCDICGETFKTESKMLKHQTIHPFIEIPNDDKPTRIFFK
ncbi:zinc finger protein 271-like [Battus philenor]|uniref:zinc finger protein 271-like n=1 Tax=Battus philenor TaxID=42288 RepID=UPI0035CFBC14